MDTGNLVIDAQAAFARERRHSRVARFFARLRRDALERRRLVLLDDALGGAPAARGRGLGVRTIALDSIVGTGEAAKAGTFDGGFRPARASRTRWERLWMASRRGAAVPPISVYRVGDRHFVNDGHHRVSVAWALGMAAIEAEVTDLGPPPGVRAPAVSAHCRARRRAVLAEAC